MRILIDLQGAQTSSRFRGIGRYSLDLTKGLLKNSGDHEIYVLLSGFLPEQVMRIRSELEDLISKERILIWEGVSPASYVESNNEWRRQVSKLTWESYVDQIKPDIVLLTSFFEGYGDDFAASTNVSNGSIPVAVIFYDLIPFLYPQDYLADPSYSKWYGEKIEAIKKANYFLSISQQSRIDAIQHLGVDEKYIENISSAVSENFSKYSPPCDPISFLKKFGITKPFLMYTSATDPRKNHLRLIEAYAKLDHSVRSLHQIVFAGGMPSEHHNRFKVYALSKGLKAKELIFTGELNDDDLKALYSLCKAFIFPSWSEGFGLPVLEAMQFGKAVIASNRSSIPEIIDFEDALFDPFNVDDISAKIERVLKDQVFRESLEKNSKVRTLAFSWDKTANAAIASLERWRSNDLREKPAQSEFANSENLKKLLCDVATLSYPHTDNDLLSAAQAISLNFRNDQQPQLLVDISVLVEQDAKTGIQRVVRNILRDWLLNPPNGYKVEPVYAKLDRPYCYARKFTHNFLGNLEDQNCTDDVIEFSSGDIFIGLDLLYPHLALKHQHYYQKMRSHGVSVNFVVYDLLPILLPQYVVPGAAEAHSKWLNMVAGTDSAICISRSVASELKIWLDQNSSSISKSFDIKWFHLGGDEEQLSESVMPDISVNREVIEKLISAPSFLSVGTLEPRKGHAQLLASFELLWSEGCDVNLVFVGKQGWKVDDLVQKMIGHPELGKRFFWLDGISDVYLQEIYKSCTCLIASSEGEGFGLPLIEAAHKGMPIIARNIPVFQEVAGQHAYYFNGETPKDLAKCIQDWLELSKLGRIPKSENMPWLTWKESADQLLEGLGIRR